MKKKQFSYYHNIAENAFKFSHKNKDWSIGEIKQNLASSIEQSKVLKIDLNLELCFGCLHLICNFLNQKGECDIPNKSQLAGAAAIYEGNIIHMENGEGKTLTAALAASIIAKMGRKVHVTSSNDYLVRRDATWMWPLYDFLDLKVVTRERESSKSCKIVGNNFDNVELIQIKDAYKGDILYTDFKALAIDYLNDNLVKYFEDKFQGILDFVIIDEIDSLLIDNARDPLNISETCSIRNTNERYQFYKQAWSLINTMIVNEHFKISKNNVFLTDYGIEYAEKKLSKSIYNDPNVLCAKMIIQCLKSKYIKILDIDYTIHNNSIVPIDLSTGRMCRTERFSDGLNQALLIKENLSHEKENKTIATTSIQNYYRKYFTISGMSGSLWSVKKEIEQTYSVQVVKIPPNKPSKRIDTETLVYRTDKERNIKACEDAIEKSKNGRPVLIGVEDELVAKALEKLLKKQSVTTPIILTATEHQDEADKLKQLGNTNLIMISAKLAGRGTDIRINKKGIESGGLHVIVLGVMEERIENQLRGRAGRQGKPGSSLCIVSLEDKLMLRFGSEKISKMMSRMGLKEGEVIQHSMISKSIDRSRKKVYLSNYLMRQGLYEVDSIINDYREYFYGLRNETISGLNDPTELLKKITKNVIIKSFSNLKKTKKSNLDITTAETISDLKYMFPSLTNHNFSSIGSFKGDKNRIKAINNSMLNHIDETYLILKEITSDYSHDPIDELLKLCMVKSLDNAWSDFIVKVNEVHQRAARNNISSTWLGNYFKDKSHSHFMSFIDATEKKAIHLWSKISTNNLELCYSVINYFKEKTNWEDYYLALINLSQTQHEKKDEYDILIILWEGAKDLEIKDKKTNEELLVLRLKVLDLLILNKDISNIRIISLALLRDTVDYKKEEIITHVYNKLIQVDPKFELLLRIIHSLLFQIPILISESDESQIDLDVIISNEFINEVKTYKLWNRLEKDIFDHLTDLYSDQILENFNIRFTKVTSLIINNIFNTEDYEVFKKEIVYNFGDIIDFEICTEEVYVKKNIQKILDHIHEEYITKINETSKLISDKLISISESDSFVFRDKLTFSDEKYNHEIKLNKIEGDETFIDNGFSMDKYKIIAYKAILKECWLPELYYNVLKSNEKKILNFDVILNEIDFLAIPYMIRTKLIS